MHTPVTRMSISFRAANVVAFVVIAWGLTAALGCRGTPMDVAKGHPTEPESSYVSSDYEHKEPSTLEQLSPENWGKNFRKMVGLGPNEKVARQTFEEGEKLFGEKKFDDAAKKFGSAAVR